MLHSCSLFSRQNSGDMKTIYLYFLPCRTPSLSDVCCWQIRFLAPRRHFPSCFGASGCSCCFVPRGMLRVAAGLLGTAGGFSLEMSAGGICQWERLPCSQSGSLTIPLIYQVTIFTCDNPYHPLHHLKTSTGNKLYWDRINISCNLCVLRTWL